MQPHEGFKLWHLMVSIGGGATFQRVLTDIARSMPPLPPTAGYFARWGYAAMQAVTGHDLHP